MNNRVQITTYLNTEESIEEWAIVKAHLAEDATDAAVLRELIHNKAVDIQHGRTRRQTAERAAQGIQEIRDILEKHGKILDAIVDHWIGEL